MNEFKNNTRLEWHLADPILGTYAYCGQIHDTKY